MCFNTFGGALGVIISPFFVNETKHTKLDFLHLLAAVSSIGIIFDILTLIFVKKSPKSKPILEMRICECQHYKKIIKNRDAILLLMSSSLCTAVSFAISNVI